MNKRIVVRTIHNISYIGEQLENNLFNEEGILIKINKNVNMKVFIPTSEIFDVIIDGEIKVL